MGEYRDFWEVATLEDLQTKMELTENYEFNGRPIAIVVTDPSQFERFRVLEKKRK